MAKDPVEPVEVPEEPARPAKSPKAAARTCKIECPCSEEKAKHLKQFKVTLQGKGTEEIGETQVKALCAADAIAATLSHYNLDSATVAAFPEEV